MGKKFNKLIMKHKEAIRILQEHLNIAERCSRYPYHLIKDGSLKTSQLSEYTELQKNRVEQLKLSIEFLINDNNEQSD